MKTLKQLLMVILVAGASMPAQSTEQTQKFTVEKMDCALCPITVKKAIEKVASAMVVSIDIDSKIATVTYDNSVSTADDIAKAVTNAGYPAKRVP